MNTTTPIHFVRRGFPGRRMPLIWAMLTAASLSGAAVGATSTDVGYSDLDLARVEGAAVLYGRIRNAAQEVCSHLESRQLARAISWRRCVNDAIASAVAKIDRPALESYYRSKVGAKASVRTANATRQGE